MCSIVFEHETNIINYNSRYSNRLSKRRTTQHSKQDEMGEGGRREEERAACRQIQRSARNASLRNSRARQHQHILSDYRLNTSAQTRWCFQQSAYADTHTPTTEQSENHRCRVQKYTYRAERNHRFRIQKYTYRAERNHRFRVQKSWKLNFHVLIHALMEKWIIQCERKKMLTLCLRLILKNI